MLYLGADHRGFELKEKIKIYLKAEDIAFEDVGALVFNQDDDYTDYAEKVALGVAKNPGEYRGIVVCGSGVGVDVVANKFKGVISGLLFNLIQAQEATSHDHLNIAAIAADYTTQKEALEIIAAFLKTPYSQEARHVRRVEKIRKIEGEPR